MSWRKTLILALVLILVGGFYLWDRSRIEKGKAREEEQKRLFPWGYDKVAELFVQRGSENLRLVRGDKGEWLLKEPVQAPGDQDQIKALVERLLRAKRERKIADDPKELAPYGLDKPLFAITVKGKEPEGERVLNLGAKNPTEVFFYGQIQGEKEVFLVSDTVRREANKEIFELRDKTLWNLASDRVQELRIRSSEQGVTLRKDSDGQWRIVEPKALPADGDAVQSLLFKLGRLKVAAFEDSPSKPLSELGLDPPQREVALRLKDPDEERILRVGVETPEGEKDPNKARRYARLEGGGGVVLLPSREVGDLPAAADEWRVKALVVFDRDKVQRWEIRRGDEVLSGRKVDKGNWEIEQPEKLPADNMKVNDLLWAIKDARVSGFLDGEPPALDWDKPAATVSIWVEGQEGPLELQVGAPTPDGQGLYVKAPAQQGVVQVDKKLEQELKVSAKDLRDRRFLSFDLPAVRRAELIWEGKRLEMARKGERWKIQHPQEEEVEAHKVQGLLWTVREARFEEIPAQPPDATVTGKDAPRIQVTLWGDAKEPMGSLFIGKPSQDRPGTAYAWAKGGSPVYLVADKLVEEMERELREISRNLSNGKSKP